MPSQKDFKRLVRRRMQKTGESYTAARAQLLRTKLARTTRPRVRRAAPAATATPAVPRADFAKVAGMSDAAVKAKTGCTWEKWVTALDHHQAETWTHLQIADFVHTKYRIPAWWTQMVTVGYERIRGLRDRGQRRDGAYEATKSRTFAVPVATLYAAFTTPRKRAMWLPKVKLTVRKATPHKSVRIKWEDDTPVEVHLTSKGAATSRAQVQHRRLPDKAAAIRLKQYWTERFEALDLVLTA